MHRMILTVLVPALLAGCASWVELTDEGAAVRQASAGETAGCERIGATTATTLDRVLIAERGGERMQEELLRLARNEAGNMGGNVVVPESVIEEGRQTFGVYRCP